MAMDRSWELYLGSFRLVEDTGDESDADYMFKFGELIADMPSDSTALAMMDFESRGLRTPSQRIAKACRRLIEQSWKSLVPQLREK